MKKTKHKRIISVYIHIVLYVIGMSGNYDTNDSKEVLRLLITIKGFHCL